MESFSVFKASEPVHIVEVDFSKQKKEVEKQIEVVALFYVYILLFFLFSSRVFLLWFLIIFS